MKYNLSKKLFTITLALLLLLMGFTLVFQLLFFQRFYEDKKVKSLTKEVNRFSNLYSYQLNGDQNTLKALSSFENRNNAKIAIFSISNGNLTLRYLSTNLENDDSLTSFCSELINDKDLINKVLEDNTAISSIFYNYSSATKKLGVVSPIILKSYNSFESVTISLSFSNLFKYLTNLFLLFTCIEVLLSISFIFSSSSSFDSSLYSFILFSSCSL